MWKTGINENKSIIPAYLENKRVILGVPKINRKMIVSGDQKIEGL